MSKKKVYIVNVFSKQTKILLLKTKRDSMLFGNKLSDTIKIGKSMKKLGKKIKVSLFQ